MTKKDKLKYSQIAALIAVAALIYLCISTFTCAHAGVPAYAPINQSANTFSDTMTTAWKSLTEHGYPNEIIIQLNVVNCSDTTKRMVVYVQTSCEATTDAADDDYITLGKFTNCDGSTSIPFSDPQDTLIGGTTVVGSSHYFWAPRNNYSQLSTANDSTFSVPAIPPPCKWIRFKCDANGGNWTISNVMLARD